LKLLERHSDLRARAFSRSILCLAILFSAFAANGAAAAAPQPLQTAFVDPTVFTGPNAAAGLSAAKAAGASMIKVPLFWNEVAPATRPAGFKPSDPSDPAYNWAQLDAQLRLIRAHGLQAIVYVSSAPTWAMRTIGGYPRAEPGQFASFALAAVRRYAGSDGLPRVRFWEAWNEPNKVPNRAAKASAATWYRSLVNAFAASAHTVPGNSVVAGGLAPFGISTSVAPLEFMKSLLSAPVHFDIWSTDPYTAGGPTHKAAHAGDVSIAELPEMNTVLQAGVRGGKVVSRQPVRFWVTEFSWDSNPPDPEGVPAALEGRWVAEALYRMWSAGVSLVNWYTLVDQPVKTSPYQSGLYYLGTTFAQNRPKPAFTAFRFPFVAYPGSKGVTVWGRTPTSRSGPVVVEQRGSSGWRRVGVVQADRVGIFEGDLQAGGKGPLRARFASAKATSLPFSLVEPPDHPYQPFGAALPATGGTKQTQELAAAAAQYVEVVPTASGGGASVSSLQAAGPSPETSGRSAVGAAVQAVGTAGGRAVAALAAIVATLTFALGTAAVCRKRSPEARTGASAES
jgi:hypothetical protein